jgi:hypothetical protein
MKRRRREEELEEEEQEHEPVASQATPADRVLELQKTAGNRATGEAIARWGLGWLPLAAAPRWPKEPQVVIDGDLVLPLVSYSGINHRPAGTPGGGSPGDRDGGAERRSMEDVFITVATGDHSAKLAHAATQGRHLGKVEIIVPGHGGGIRFTLIDVVVSSYQVTDQLDTYALNFAKHEFSTAPPPPR